MIEIGRVCVKIAGRDAGQKCVVVEVLENNLVLIDGQTRRRKCNMRHLEPLDQKVDIKKGADHATVCKALEIEVVEKKPKQAAARPRKTRQVKEKPVKEKKPAKKEEKKKSLGKEMDKKADEKKADKKTETKEAKK